jgi:hypothetical protein
MARSCSHELKVNNLLSCETVTTLLGYEAGDIVGICNQEMASEDGADITCAVVRNRVHELVRVLYLL